ncbi:MAG: hypothetical protein KDC53_03265 [Saprospiraceae bacterium]|nr:hypothetical protein [Saprospiraceae bacterium]
MNHINLIYSIFFISFLFLNSLFSQEQLELKGALSIENSNSETPIAGTIRWNATSNDFEGYDGSIWRSLTANSGVNGSTGTISDYGVGLTIENQKLFIAGANGLDGFGSSVSSDSIWSVIGAPYTNVNGQIAQGVAYVYKFEDNKWVIKDTLTGSDSQNYESFGNSVAISGDRIVVGAKDSGISGKVYFYTRNGDQWIESQKIFAPNSDDGQFGYKVDIDGNYAIISAYLANVGPNIDQGRVYIYHYNGSFWEFQDDITAGDGVADDQFGSSVAIKGDLAVVSAEVKMVDGFTDRGAVYLFGRNGIIWEELAFKPEPQVSNDYQNFGKSIDFDGTSLLVCDAGYGDITGYFFSWNDGWFLSDVVIAPSNPDGGSGAFYQDRLMLFLSGFCWTNSGWKNNKLFSNGDGIFGNQESFCTSVEMTGNSIFVSNSYDGKVYVYLFKNK